MFVSAFNKKSHSYIIQPALLAQILVPVFKHYKEDGKTWRSYSLYFNNTWPVTPSNV